MKCPLCHSTDFSTLINRADSTVSLTSVSGIVDHRLQFNFCEHCQHGFKPPIPNTQDFYSSQYKISLENEEHDQIIVTREGISMFRNEFQAEILERWIDCKKKPSILDFGAGKGQTLKYLHNRHPAVDISLFDFDNDYKKNWNWIPPENRLIREMGSSKLYDYITSFFVMEHVEDLSAYLGRVAQLLKEDGEFIFAIPNMYVNWGDMIVVDHIHHYSEHSINQALNAHGLYVDVIDMETMPQAYFVRAKKQPAARCVDRDRTEEARAIANFWKRFNQRLEAIDNDLPPNSVIFGAGFYGSYIFTQLKSKNRIRAFVDTNVTMNNLERFGLPIVHPDSLDYHPASVVVGLNPKTVSDQISRIEFLKKSETRFIGAQV